MTDSGPPEEAPHPSDPAVTEGSLVPVSPDDGVGLGRPGLRTFSLEHRVAPGLYLVGWLACLAGLGLLILSILSSASAVRSAMLIVALLFLSMGLVAAAGQQALERRARAWTGYAGPSPFLVFTAAVPIALLLSLFAGFVLTAIGVPTDSPTGIVAASLATAIPFIGLVRLLVIGTGALTVADLGLIWRGSDTLRGVASGILWGIVVFLGTGILAVALSTLLPIPPGPLPNPTTAGERIADLLVVAVLAPVSEEVFFRGFATTAWARTMPRAAAILRSGLFFAFIHVLTLGGADTFAQGLGFAAFAFLGRIPVSLALAAVFLRRGSLYESLALHSTFNAVPLVILFLTAR